MARSGLAPVGAALLAERSITQLERNLETASRDLREARIAAGEAAAASDKARTLEALERQVRLLGFVGKDFQQLLEPAEVKDVLFQARRLARQADELAAQLGKPPAEVEAQRKAHEEALASIRPPVEPPLNPSLTLKAPEVVTIPTLVPTPFYKQWWFYLAAIASGVAVGTTAAALALQSTPADPGLPIRFGKVR